MIQAADFQRALQLTLLSPSTKKEWDIRTADLNRPGMQFCGFYEFFAFERPQVIGKVEMSYLDKQSAGNRRSILDKYMSYRIPCIVICRDLTPPPELLELAQKHEIFVFRTSAVTSKFTVAAIHYLNRCLAPHITRHGILLDVYGVGVLLTGKSGVGKSEAALELIKRGHQLVADDVVDICRISEERLIGTCPERIRHLMEIRGIGIIDMSSALMYARRAERSGWQVLVVLSALQILFGLVVLFNPWWSEPGKLFDVIGRMLLFSSVVSIVRLVLVWPIKGE